ncbi:hypothetical protein L1987_41185 [Smallanthus sonchifolius]|uniref:Uncharacterized protein n=1 Tax=Smallanthus sonchifolius TaxID=185202 RepID=A0ACB9GU06_9ASTR|nr:hypothetical protein L1987_41185 [Smallanthus sonchifolius]
MGEISLAVSFTCSSMVNLIHMYSQPFMPEMHYIHPITVTQLDSLRHHATQIVTMRLSQAEPPLRKEVVEYMLDVGCEIRQSKANFLRIKGVFGGLIAVGNWFGEMYSLKNPISTVVIHIIFFILAMHPELILSSIFLSLFVTGVWNYKHRPRYPPHMDARLSCVDNARPDEELDTFQRVVGDIATQGERLQSLLSWRDPVATQLFVIFCLIAAIVIYATPFYVVVIQTVIYVLNHLSFQNKLPSVPVNFFRRLPARTDSML